MRRDHGSGKWRTVSEWLATPLPLARRFAISNACRPIPGYSIQRSRTPTLVCASRATRSRSSSVRSRRERSRRTGAPSPTGCSITSSERALRRGGPRIRARPTDHDIAEWGTAGEVSGIFSHATPSPTRPLIRLPMSLPRPTLLALAVLSAAISHPAAAQQFTLDDIMSAPFASDLVAAHRGHSVAWIVTQRGARNVWVASAPSWQGRQITKYTDDDGQEIESLTFTADGKSIVYVRGGAPNRAGERPNPSLIPGGVDQAIWIASVDDGAAPRKIAEGSSPRLSPSGDSIAFVRAGQIWIGGVRADAAAPTQLSKLRGGSSNLRWSPDGKRLAFVSNRQRHAFVGVWDFASRSLRYMDPT